MINILCVCCGICGLHVYSGVINFVTIYASLFGGSHLHIYYWARIFFFYRIGITVTSLAYCLLECLYRTFSFPDRVRTFKLTCLIYPLPQKVSTHLFFHGFEPRSSRQTNIFGRREDAANLGHIQLVVYASQVVFRSRKRGAVLYLVFRVYE